MTRTDILVVGGGIAGLSAAAALSSHADVLVLEGEEQIGYHSSGRSATMVHYALGDALVRALTLASRPFFDSPPDGYSDVPLGRPMPVLVHAREEERAAIEALAAEIESFADIERLDARAVHRMCPILKSDARYGIADRNGTRLDPHALLQANLKQLRRGGGRLMTGCRVASIGHSRRSWTIVTQKGDRFSAGVLVNAAGSWADEIARLAGVEPVGLEPKRRTIITFDAPVGAVLQSLPFTKTVGDELYFAPEGGRLFASPMDEVPSEPCDAQPGEFEIALAAYRMEERTSVKVERIRHSWAGLRTFTRDRHPVVGFAPDCEDYFWLAGQGGFGLQTSPAIAAVAKSLITGGPWPLAQVAAEDLGPGRFIAEAA